MRFYSPGKVLITAEYAVLDGAKALAIPTKLGQSLEVTPTTAGPIRWTALKEDGQLWFEGHFDWDGTKWVSRSQQAELLTLERIFEIARSINPQALDPSLGYDVVTKLEFPTDFGLGSSSTLINNVAQWTKTDAFKLQEIIFGGSGYDIAAAKSQGPILYQRTPEGPIVETVSLNWPFTKQLYFLHLKQKQNSRESIAGYRQTQVSAAQLEALTGLTDQFVACRDFASFNSLMETHENLVANMIGQQTIQQLLFPEFGGNIKSLGGWGGDLVLVASEKDPTAYFKAKGFETLIPFSKIIP